MEFEIELKIILKYQAKLLQCIEVILKHIKVNVSNC